MTCILEGLSVPEAGCCKKQTVQNIWYKLPTGPVLVLPLPSLQGGACGFHRILINSCIDLDILLCT